MRKSPAGVQTWAGAAALSRCWEVGAGGAGAPSTKAWRGRGELPTWAGPGPGWTFLARAGAELPAARGGVGAGGWGCRSWHWGLCGAERPAGRASFRGQNWAHAAVASGRTGPGLAPKSEREKVSNGTDVRPLTPTPRVRKGAGGDGALVVVPGARGVGPRAGSAETRSQPPPPRRPPVLPDLDARAGHTLANTPCPVAGAPFGPPAPPPPPRPQKNKLQVFTPCFKCA